jgi:hypothetical protein
VSGPAAGRPATTPVRAAPALNVGHAAAGCPPELLAPGPSVFRAGEAAPGEAALGAPPIASPPPPEQAATAQATPISAVPQIAARMR